MTARRRPSRAPRGGTASRETAAWLKRRPSLGELREAHPADWDAIQAELTETVNRSTPQQFRAYVLSASQAPEVHARAASSVEVRRQMRAAALKQLCFSAATGVTHGRVRFNLLNGWIAQRLLFSHGLERKPISMRWFRLLWPLLWQRRLLMPLVGPKGIYCFYSRRLIDALAAEIGDRACVEIAAGDGTLSRFLSEAGVRITATDDQSWSHSLTFPDTVAKLDARRALAAHRPQVVVCSWPPAGNPFEGDVFKTRSVELYVVIASRHRFASGNWTAYERQQDFEFAEEPSLSRLVLPPELEAAVYVFRRRVGNTPTSEAAISA